MTRQDNICVCLSGGLGNQLFQYAAGRAASLRLGCPLVLDISSLNKASVRAYALDQFAIDANLLSADQALEENWRTYNQPSFHYTEDFEGIEPGTRLSGYFQSELFSRNYEQEIRQDLRLVQTAPSFEDKAHRIDRARIPVSIHVRRGDYVENARTSAYHGICGPDYYTKALRIMRGLLEGPATFFVFSDDPAAAQDLFGHEDQRSVVLMPTGSPAEDMKLMARCHHQIQANSSFSWWGSWLNTRPERIVIAPRHWLARETLRNLNTVDLYLDGTIII